MMLLHIIMFNILTFFNAVQTLLQTTKGYVWPQPFKQTREPIVYIYNPNILKYTITHHNCQLLQKAISRCKYNINLLETIANRRRMISEPPQKRPEKLTELRITLLNICEDFPNSKMDESYTLKVAAVSDLISNSIWGIIRGLETFSQLLSLTRDNKRVFVRATEISDKPKYPHRGLMLDTSKSYVLVDAILKILDTMAMIKMNVFHWRFVDDQSLSNKDAVSYTKKDMWKIITHAKNLGIRVVPEFNFPLHLGPHYNISQTNVFLHPLKKGTFKQLRQLYEEVQETFPEQYLHLGDVNLIEWAEDIDIINYLKRKHLYFDELSQKLLDKFYSLLRKDTTPIVWQPSKDVENGLPEHFIVQTQKASWLHRGVKGLKRGRQAIFSIFLNMQAQMNVETTGFEEYYNDDPRHILYGMEKNHSLEKNIIGQEVVLGTDIRNEYHLKSSSWLHISVIAEVLWSHVNGTRPENTIKRLAENDCRMTFRGVHTGSNENCLDVGNIELDLEKQQVKEKTKEPADDEDNSLLEWGSLVHSLTSSAL